MLPSVFLINKYIISPCDQEELNQPKLALSEVFSLWHRLWCEDCWQVQTYMITTSLCAIKSQWHSVGSLRSRRFTGDEVSHITAKSLSHSKKHSNRLTVCEQSPCPGPVSLNVSFVSGYLGFPPERTESFLLQCVVLWLWKTTTNRLSIVRGLCTCHDKLSGLMKISLLKISLLVCISHMRHM